MAGLLGALIPAGPPRAAEIEIVPKVGFAFEHFGESYRITAERDTVTAINDYGTIGGITVRTVGRPASRFNLDGTIQWGNQTGRVGVEFDGRLVSGRNEFELVSEGTWRKFHESGDYSISSDYAREFLRVGWTRRLDNHFSLRLRHAYDGTWYTEPDQYNLSGWYHQPRVDLSYRTEDYSEARVGYRFTKRSVPDSTSLGYDRHSAEGEVNWLFGWSTSIDVSDRLERRIYDPLSVRESSWENRLDLRFEFGSGQYASFRILHANEIARYDEPDELDFDFDWARTGFQVEIHPTESLDFSLTPLYAFLASSSAPQEEYTETGLEFGIDWRLGRRVWVNLANEVGRRDYEVSAVDFDTVASLDDVLANLDSEFDTAFSDYLYYRLTLLFTADLTTGLSANLFVNWQPEDHHVNRHDTNTRIVSGGVDYRF